jgi:hypothetical protein
MNDKSSGLPALQIFPESQYGRFFSIHSEAEHVWMNILADCEDLTANVPHTKDSGTLDFLIKDIFLPFFVRNDMAILNENYKCGYEPLVGEPKWMMDRFEIPFVAERVARTADKLSLTFKPTDPLKHIILADIYGDDDEEAIVEYFNELRAVSRNFQARRTRKATGSCRFQIVMMGRME